MIVGTLTVRLYAPWVHSLKDKRMVVKSLLAKLHNTFNVSAAEVDEQDVHQTIVLGVACVSCSRAQADSVLQKVLGFIESHTEAEVTDVQLEIL